MTRLPSPLARLVGPGSLILLLGSCTDPTTGTTQVEGQVVDLQSRRPVGHGTVQVYGPGKAGGYRTVGAPQACDAAGRFDFAFEATSPDAFILRAEAPPGYLTDWEGGPNLTAGRRNRGLLVPARAPAWVRLVLVDEPPKSRVEMTVQGYSGSGEQLRFPKDTVLIRPLQAGLTVSIGWFIYYLGQGPDTHSFQRVLPASLDTVTVRVPF